MSRDELEAHLRTEENAAAHLDKLADDSYGRGRLQEFSDQHASAVRHWQLAAGYRTQLAARFG